MPTVTIELPSQGARTASNMRRWAELLEDSSLARIEGRIETDRHEMREKMTLYFDAGAEEVWLCDLAGKISFHPPVGVPSLTRSRLCPEFPLRIDLR